MTSERHFILMSRRLVEPYWVILTDWAILLVVKELKGGGWHIWLVKGISTDRMDLSAGWFLGFSVFFRNCNLCARTNVR